MKGFHYALIVLMAGLVVTGCGKSTTETSVETEATIEAENALEQAEEALENAMEKAEEAINAAEETAEEAMEAAEESAEEAVEEAVDNVEEALTGDEETVEDEMNTLEVEAETEAEVRSEVVYAEFTEETFEELKNSGEAFALTFHADWCPTCVAADKEIMGLEAPLPGSVLKVDYDTATELKKQYGVTKQHTAVFFDAEGNTKTMPGFTVEDLQNNL